MTLESIYASHQFSRKVSLEAALYSWRLWLLIETSIPDDVYYLLP